MAGDDLALAGRRVFGKVIEAGPHTCVVRRADQASYRDVVQLVKVVDGTPALSVRPASSKSGDRQCRVRHDQHE